MYILHRSHAPVISPTEEPQALSLTAHCLRFFFVFKEITMQQKGQALESIPAIRYNKSYKPIGPVELFRLNGYLWRVFEEKGELYIQGYREIKEDPRLLNQGA